ncbi:MAG: ABC transporter substrate-binding protein [Elusimicrobiota bacterium]|jgi:NitT/TauT family transport system substrate-binding protein|nr:ABC transporter substrate-binding protein [Elusimicrobiota bacterium]
MKLASKALKSLVCMLSIAVVLPSLAFGADAKYPYGENNISYSGSICGSPTAIAKEKGFFDEEGVKINVVGGVSFEAQRTALATGKLAVVNGDFQFFPAVYNGVDVKLIAGLHEGCIKVLVPNNSPIKSAKDLKGKKIGVDEIGGTPMSVVSVLMGSQGFNPQTDAQWIPYPNDQLITALEKGEIDVAAAWDPFATIIEQRGGYRVISDISTDPLFAGKNCCFLFASGKIIKENPGQIAAILRAYNKATKWMGDNPDEAAAILVNKKYVATNDVKLVATLIKQYKYGNHSGIASNAQSKQDAVYFATQLTTFGYLPKNLNVQTFVNNMYVDIFAIEAASKKK